MRGQRRGVSQVRGRGVALCLAAIPALLALVGGWAYRWVDEDAFINFRIIDNLLAGRGFVYNPGERVEADSDPLWVLLLSVVHLVSPFLSLEWLSVLLGLAFAAAAFAVGARAGQRLLERRGLGLGIPIGLVAVASLPVLWEFATSGLETSMALAWIAGCWWLLVASVDDGRWGRAAALLMGVGWLIRPELLLMSAAFLAALLAADQRRRGWGSAARLAGVAAALPLLAELLRAAYYGLLVPNTGLAKDAGGSWWSQGLRYLGDLSSPYWLWLPGGLAIALLVVLLVGRARAQDRSGLLLVLVPVAAGLLDALYVIEIGGDYMHGRLLLPALFAISLPVVLGSSQLRSAAVVAAAGIVAWAGVAIVGLRSSPHPPRAIGLQTVFISDERSSWIAATGRAHPITAGDYAGALSGRAGRTLAAEAAAIPSGRQRQRVITNPFLPVGDAALRRARSPLPFSLAVNVPGAGVVGYLAGPRVYVFDAFSLANPIGSHFEIVEHARPGHEKWVPASWMLGRLGPPGVAPVPGAGSARDIAAARRSVSCGGLARYLEDITGPWSAAKALSSLLGSPSATTLRFSADPEAAQAQLCD